ncbi:TRAP transporter small permease [Mangrovicella endophytica]|uniref:TRAP transporter small permease n=1 Tax=Mangrovicella endophytica TaxID=2066697 RepID=UPI000C9E31DA|nr:TRAP transporter small permease [Mangrovicella endophytica]
MASAPMPLVLARTVERGIEWLCNAVMLVTGLAMLALLTLVAAMRYLLESGLNAAPDLTEVLFAFFVVAGIVQAARMGVHVATQMLLSLLPPAGRRVLSIIIHVVTAATYLLLAWYAYQNAVIANDQTSPVLQIPMSVGYGALTAGLALVAVCSLTAIVRLIVGHERVVVDLADPGAAVT